MFGQNQMRAFEDIFNFQRDADRLFTNFWNDVAAPAAMRPVTGYPIQVHSGETGWQLQIPLPGIDPRHVTIEVTGSTVSIKAEQDGGRQDGETRFEQAVTLPKFLDLDRITASHRHGMLELTVPLKESVKPRRVQIDGVETPTPDSRKQITV